MASVNFTCLVLLACFIDKITSLQVSREMYKKNEKRCLELSKNPYFDIEQVIGKPWRIYYTWNIHIETKCLNMVFKNATPSIINRFYVDMSEYLEVQPVWDAATIYATMGAANNELLLFADHQGVAGVFTGVANVRRGNIAPSRQSVPIMKFFIKLAHGGRYLLMFDCKIGVGSLSSKEPPYRTEVASVANTFSLGEGAPACTTDIRKDEIGYF